MQAQSLAQSLLGVPKLGFTIDEASVICGFSRASLYRELMSGRLPSMMDGRRRVIARVDLEQFIERKRTQG